MELKSRIDKSLQKTEVFVSLFTPERKSGDLMRAETLWKTILTVDGREIPGQPKKITLLPIEIVSLYPMHNRWSTGYLVSFDIPLKDVESKKTQLVITGPLGATTLKFRPIKEGPLRR
jgi:hypothetical protein